MLINNRYEINAQTDFIDSGGFGKVFKAFDTETNITVTLKQFSINNKYERLTLKTEIEHAKTLSHPNIVKYLDYFETHGIDSLGQQVNEQWAVMEYIAGGNLATFIEQKSQEEKQNTADEIINGIINGLDYLHTRRWDSVKNDWVKTIHRDLKPANILLQIENGKITPKICDFGMSKEVLESQNNSQATSTAANSTIEYAAPELFNTKLRKEGVLQTNYDFWALGVIIYKYFTDKLPFGSRQEGNTPEQIMSAILESKPDFKPLPVQWRVFVENCLMKDTNKRIIISQVTQNSNSPKPSKTKRGYVLFTVFLTLFVIFGLVYFFKNKNKTQNSISKNNLSDTVKKIDNSIQKHDLSYELKGKLKTSNTKNNFESNVKPNSEKEETKANINRIENNPVNPKTNINWRENYDGILDFSQGFAGVIKNNKCGYVNTNGVLMWNGLEWDIAWNFKDNYARVKRNEKYGFLNLKGQLLWGGLEWDLVSDFYSGYAYVEKYGKCGFINTKGILIWGGLIWDDASYFSEGFAFVGKYGKYGFINTEGKLMWDGLIWDDVSLFKDGYAKVKRNGKWYYINTKGECVINCS